MYKIWNSTKPSEAIERIYSEFVTKAKVYKARLDALGGYVILCTDNTNPELMSAARELGWIKQDAAFLTDMDVIGVEALPTAKDNPNGESYFKNLRHFKEFRYFYNVRRINETTFQECTKMTSIRLPDNCLEINTDAFVECSALSEVDFGINLLSIDCWAFRGCPMLRYVNLPRRLNYFEGNSFAECPSLAYVNIDEFNQLLYSKNGVVFGGDSENTLVMYPFENKAKVVLPSTSGRISDYVICEAHELTTITIPDSYSYFSWYNFYNCPKLSKIYFTRFAPTRYPGNCFVGLAENYRIYVPNGAVELYQEAWPHLAEHIYPFSADNNNDDDIIWGD